MRRVRELLKYIGHDVSTVSPGAKVYDAMELMGKKEAGAVVVVEKEKMVGIISENDYARRIILKGKNSRETTVREIMTPDVIHTSPDKKLQKCLSLMTKNRIHHLPVLEKERLVGLLTMEDIKRKT
jgi:CBS domain-containing protein